jgi:hypothetical protein
MTIFGPLPLPPPESLPDRRGDLRRSARRLAAHGIGVGLLAAWSDAAVHSGPSVPGYPSIHDGQTVAVAPERKRIARLLAGDELVGRRPLAATPERADRQEEDCDEHDRYFDVVRVGGDPAATFLAGLLLAYVEVLTDAERAGTTLPAAEWQDLIRVPVAVFDFAATRADRGGPGDGRPGDGWEIPVPAGPGPATGDAAEDRWRVGHHQFFVLIQAITVALSCALTAAQEEDKAELADCLDLVTTVVLGSAASMRFAADFPRAVYEAAVRPDMLPPTVSAGFSGLQTRDHRYLVQIFGRLRDALPAMVAAGPAYERFVGAVERMYQAHAWVCARFGGEELPSLRMAARSAGCSGKSGVDVVREFAGHRLTLLDPDRSRTH